MSNGSDGSDADLGEGELKQSSGDEAGLIKTKMGSPNKQSADPGLTNGYDTFKKKRSIQGGTAETKEQIIDFIEQEPLFDHQEHRMQIMDVIRNYVKEARRKEILVILDNRVFDVDTLIELGMSTDNDHDGFLDYKDFMTAGLRKDIYTLEINMK